MQIINPGGGVWGSITGTLSNQTDLNSALGAKYNVPIGTTAQYIRGDGTFATYSAGGAWGSITGTLSAQTDLQTALDGKRAVLAGNNLVYTTSGVGVQAQLSYSTATTGFSIAQRDVNGCLSVGAPTSAAHATTKTYVDGRLSANQRTAINALTAASTAADIVAALQAV